MSQRIQFRRDQVRATQRCITAVDDLFRGAGSGSMVFGHPVERAWRDLHVAGTHVCNTTELPYAAWGAHRFGAPVPRQRPVLTGPASVAGRRAAHRNAVVVARATRA